MTKDLLSRIEKGALDPKADLATLLRLCIQLGGETGSGRLREWAGSELKGYRGSDDLPPYREVFAPLQMDGIFGNYRITGRAVPVELIPEFARDDIGNRVELREPVAVLVDLVGSAAKKQQTAFQMSPPMSGDLVRSMNDVLARGERDMFGSGFGLPPSQQVERIYWSVSTSPVAGVIDTVRTTLVELAAEMRAGTPRGQETPSAEIAEQAVNVAIYGDKNRVTVVHAGGDAAATTRGPATVGSTPESRSRRVAFWVSVAAGVIAAVAAVVVIFI